MGYLARVKIWNEKIFLESGVISVYFFGRSDQLMLQGDQAAGIWVRQDLQGKEIRNHCQPTGTATMPGLCAGKRCAGHHQAGPVGQIHPEPACIVEELNRKEVGFKMLYQSMDTTTREG